MGCPEIPGRRDAPRKRPRLEVADVFGKHGDDFLESRPMSLEQAKVLRDIVNCRTAALGGHRCVCDTCGHEDISYNSCRNRHCPKCQSLRQARWIERRKERILPTHYFHVVFTLPAELRSLTLCNKKKLFPILFHAASKTLLDLAKDKKRLGAQPGITAVLHTWTRELDFHPHLHCIVTGGGLSFDGKKWIAANQKHLFPVKVLSRLFRGKFMDALNRAYEKGEFEFAGGCAELADQKEWARVKDELYRKEWNVYAKSPFQGTVHLFEYLGRYTHRVAISNQRLISINDDGVTFYTKEGKTATLAPHEFIRRFLMHVLPAGFTKIRHYGLLAAGNVNTRLEKARRFLETEADSKDNPLVMPVSQLENMPQSWIEHLQKLTGIDLSLCPVCEKGHMIRTGIERAPPIRVVHPTGGVP